MNRDNTKKPLYRKVNTKAKGVFHDFGGDYRHSKNKKKETLEQVKGSMFGNKQRGLDYTPLFRFLLSKVGKKWDDVFSEAKSRLDKTDPIFWMVATDPDEKKDYVRVGDTSYFSGLYIDDDGILQLSNPALKPADIMPSCSCCTHTLNGEVIDTKEFWGDTVYRH